MIPVAQAQALCLDMVRALEAETVPLVQAAGRVLAAPVIATRDQPPFAASAMDGYAVKSAEIEKDVLLKVVGEAAAGHRFDGVVKAGQAVRIFTGAPMPDGTDDVVIQEDVTPSGSMICLSAETISTGNVRPAAGDFAKGDTLDAPRLLSPSDVALIAAMNQPEVTVTRRPRVALICTGDELVMPGEMPGPDQIIASNVFGLHGMLEANGAEARILPVTPDRPEALDATFDETEAWRADFVVTIGGASVGDHDLVADAMDRFGVTRAFHRIAMRPGKPLMAGQKGDTLWLGLPGNPVSAMVCGLLFLLPMVRKATGLTDVLPQVHRGTLAHDIGRNGPREHYMRARVTSDEIEIFERQDSSLLSVLSRANALAIRPVGDGPRAAGSVQEFIFL